MAKEVEMVRSEVVEAGITTAIGVVTQPVMAGNTIMAIEARTMAGMARMAVEEVEEPLRPTIEVVNQSIQPQSVR